MTQVPDSGQLHRALDDLADAVPNTPADVPGIVRAAHRRGRRRRIAGLAAGCALLLGPVLYTVLPDPAPPDHGRRVAAAPELLTVDAGVTVRIGGVGLRLDADRRYCVSFSDWSPACQSVHGIDATAVFGSQISTTDPPALRGTIAFGSFASPRIPAGVTTTVGGRTVRGTVISLPGRPGWGLWYFDLAEAPRPGPALTVTLLDGAGRPIATGRALVTMNQSGTAHQPAASSNRRR